MKIGAQSMGGMVVTNLRNSAGDIWDVWTSPLRGTTGDWLITGAVIRTASGWELGWRRSF